MKSAKFNQVMKMEKNAQQKYIRLDKHTKYNAKN